MRRRVVSSRSFWKMFVCSDLCLPLLLTYLSRLSVIRLHTPSTRSERLSPLSMLFMPSSGQGVPSTDLVLRCSLVSVPSCYFVLGVYCTILIRIFFVSYHEFSESKLCLFPSSGFEMVILRGSYEGFLWVNLGTIHRLFSPTQPPLGHQT